MTSKPPFVKSDDLSNQNPAKPEILKFWKMKLLILVLCVLSFLAGWQSKQAYSNKNCWQAGGQIVLVNEMTFCQLP